MTDLVVNCRIEFLLSALLKPALRSQCMNTAVWTALLVTSCFVVCKNEKVGKSKYFETKVCYNLDTLKYFESSVITSENMYICLLTNNCRHVRTV